MEKFKPGIIFFSITASIMILFPPVKIGFIDDGYSFIFAISGGNTLYLAKLLIQILFAFLLSILVYYIYPFLEKVVVRILIMIVLILLSTSILYIWYNHSNSLLNTFYPSYNQVNILKEKLEQNFIPQFKFTKTSRYMNKDTYSIGRSFLKDDFWSWDALPLPDSLSPKVEDYLRDLNSTELKERKSENVLVSNLDLYFLKDMLGYKYKLPKGKTVKIVELSRDFKTAKKDYHKENLEDLYQFVKLKESYENKVGAFIEKRGLIRLYGTIIMGIILLTTLLYKKFFIVKSIEKRLLKRNIK